MTRRRVGVLTLLATAIAGCIEISAPSDDVESLTGVRAAYPSIVAGDTLRDTAGVARPLTVLAFTGRGDTVHSPEGLRFFLPDTGTGARIENGYLIAGSRLGAINVVAQVPGLQTPPLTIQVVPAPDTAFSTQATFAPRTFGAADVLVKSAPLGVRVQGRVNGTLTDISGWVVRFAIVEQPERRESLAPAYLTDEQDRSAIPDNTVATDTTSGGTASRVVTLITSELRQPARLDTVVVRATVTYRGQPVKGSPVVFRVPFAPAP